MRTYQIQITSEEEISQLPKETETKLLETISVLLKQVEQAHRTLSLYLCSSGTIAQLNHTYRQKNRPTDLLSWLYEEGDADPMMPEEPWGELVYCLPVIQDQAAESGWELQDELIRLTVHGLVHLMGYDHETEGEEAEMLGIEKQLLEQIGMEGVYPT